MMSDIGTSKQEVRMGASDVSQVLTVEEAAGVLRIGRSAAYSAARTGDLPTIKVGRSLRVPRAALNRMLGLENEEGSRAANATALDITALRSPENVSNTD